MFALVFSHHQQINPREFTQKYTHKTAARKRRVSSDIKIKLIRCCYVRRVARDVHEFGVCPESDWPW